MTENCKVNDCQRRLLVAALNDIIATYEYCSEDPVDRGWAPLSDAIEDARKLVSPADRKAE